MTRDQRRAVHAYDRVAEVRRQGLLDEYRIIANAFGPNVLRDGLSMALAFVERDAAGAGNRQHAAGQFLRDLASCGLPGVGLNANLPQTVRGLPTPTEYMLVTREVLRVVLWLKRALQAAGNGAAGA